MQINRLFEIVYLLMEKKSLTAMELAAHFEVSRRTILRDIATLAEAGIPVYTSPGKGGGISILDNYVLNKTIITEEEQNSILLALQNLSATRQAGAEDLLGKLQSLFKKSGASWIEVDYAGWGPCEKDAQRFHAIKASILNGRAVQLQYAGSCGSQTERTVLPLKLVFKSKAWYLQAFCTVKQDYRTFKVNRILDFWETGQSFNSGEYSPPPMNITEPPPSSCVAIKLLFSPQAAYRMYDEFGNAQVHRNDDGSYLVSARLPEDGWLYGFLLSMGTDVQVLEPRRVRQELCQMAERIKNFHSAGIR